MTFADPETRWVVSSAEDGGPPLPRIYYFLARHKKLVRQMSEQKRRRKAKRSTGLAHIVVELAVGQVAKKLDYWNAEENEGENGVIVKQQDMSDVVAQLRRMKAA